VKISRSQNGVNRRTNFKTYDIQHRKLPLGASRFRLVVLMVLREKREIQHMGSRRIAANESKQSDLILFDFA